MELVAGAKLLDYPMFATLDGTGRLFVFESVGNVYETSEQAVESPQFRIKLLIDKDQDGTYDQATIFADKLSFPHGGVFIDGSLIASSAPDLLKLTDTDNDGVADQREILLSGWTLNVNANSLIGPFLGPDGWLYLTSAIEGFDVTTKEGQRIEGETARIWRVRKDGTDLQWISAGGMNNPIELTFAPSGEVIGTQTFFVEPQRGVRDAITYWIEGGVYGKKNSNITRDSLPRTGDLLPVISQYSRVAPSGIGSYRSTSLGKSFENNLFSAQFNTHRVIRHQIEREEGSFVIKDSPFLWTENEDFHPTDVLEDADGSLLVVETGGWFILGCPLSQVSKPQLKGGIYRIKRKEAASVGDPYGNQIQWGALTEEDLGKYLEDSRPFVADRAKKELIARGNQAVDLLETVLVNSEISSAKIRAIYGLYQINSNKARTALRKGFQLSGTSEIVATAKAAGLTRSGAFVNDLISMLTSPEPSIVRQSATALGQIGDPAAIEPLLEAARSQPDRFASHAIIYSLIELDQPDPLMAKLNDESDKLTKTVLLALNNMPSGRLSSQQVLPYLGHETLGETALQVASGHPEWAVDLIKYLNTNLVSGEISGQELTGFSNLMTSYCGTSGMQLFLQEMLQNGSNQMKELSLQVMGSCQLDPFPETWINSLSTLLLTSRNQGILMQAVRLVKLRGLSSLTRQISSMAQNAAYPASLRIAAIDVLSADQETLDNDQFTFLCSKLNHDESPILVQQAANTIANAKLSDHQLLYLTNEVLPALDPFVLPRLLPAYEGATNPEIGDQLITYISGLPSLDNFTEEYLRELFDGYDQEIQPRLNELLSKLSMVRKERIQRITALEQSLGEGSVERGRALYFGKAICSTCHTVREGGGSLGPDLTSIQKDRSVHDIIEAIVYPSVSYVREYETYKITAKSGEYRGIIKEQTPEMIMMETAPGSSVRIPVDELLSVEQLEVSMMPQGLDQLLTDEEFGDLLAYLIGKDLIY